MNFSIGDTVGGYEIVGILGSGGMGEVYRVRNVISDRVDAMKVLLAGLQRDNDFATRFLREIKVQARLVHPNIAQLYTAFENQGNLMMILELIEGMSLADMLQRGRIPLAKAIDYVSQALTALSYAHQQGVIHRDIKPGNIMVTRAGSVKLMDFGIAKAASDHSLTTTGNLIGSLYYMSPEQVRAEAVDGRADLYSLGIVLYQMATGQKTVRGRERIHAHARAGRTVTGSAENGRSGRARRVESGDFARARKRSRGAFSERRRISRRLTSGRGTRMARAERGNQHACRPACRRRYPAGFAAENAGSF